MQSIRFLFEIGTPLAEPGVRKKTAAGIAALTIEFQTLPELSKDSVTVAVNTWSGARRPYDGLPGI